MRVVLGVGCVVVVVLLRPMAAVACGGCFAPPATTTVVTAHRMAVAFSAEQTTLWDQIQYAGAPEEFVWVLPVQGGVAVELASNELFGALEEESAPVLSAPVLGSGGACPDCPCCAATSPGAPSETVTVHNTAVIGPYETATVGSADPEALVTWLREHGYGVPSATLPLIDHYVAEGMDFAVLRLRPGVGVQQMQPVRVTMPGLVPVFPLRMVGAGVAEEVELLLYVIGEGRHAPENFPHSVVAHDDLVYDWGTSSYNYDEAFEQAVGLRSWVTEHAGALSRALPGEDGEIATAGLAAPYLTRLRTRLGPRELDRDLVLGAVSLPDVSRFIEVRRDRGSTTWSCPPPGSCGDWYGRDERSSCSVGGADPVETLPAALALAWLVVAARRRSSRIVVPSATAREERAATEQ